MLFKLKNTDAHVEFPLLHYDICVDQFMKWINFREDTERHIAVCLGQ